MLQLSNKLKFWKVDKEMDEIKFTITTKMERQDYRKFLYLATFCRNKAVIPMIALIALAGSLMLNFHASRVNWVAVAISWPIFFAIAMGAVCFNVERKNRKRVKTNQTGTFDSQTMLEFYDDCVVVENNGVEYSDELAFTQFHSLLESMDYFIFYITATQAALIRKKDVEPLEEFTSFLKESFGKRYRHI